MPSDIPKWQLTLEADNGDLIGFDGLALPGNVMDPPARFTLTILKDAVEVFVMRSLPRGLEPQIELHNIGDRWAIAELMDDANRPRSG